MICEIPLFHLIAFENNWSSTNLPCKVMLIWLCDDYSYISLNAAFISNDVVVKQIVLRYAGIKSGNGVIQFNKAILVFKTLNLFLKLKMRIAMHPVRKL